MSKPHIQYFQTCKMLYSHKRINEDKSLQLSAPQHRFCLSKIGRGSNQSSSHTSHTFLSRYITRFCKINARKRNRCGHKTHLCSTLLGKGGMLALYPTLGNTPSQSSSKKRNTFHCLKMIKITWTPFCVDFKILARGALDI